MLVNAEIRVGVSSSVSSTPDILEFSKADYEEASVHEVSVPLRPDHKDGRTDRLPEPSESNRRPTWLSPLQRTPICTSQTGMQYFFS